MQEEPWCKIVIVLFFFFFFPSLFPPSLIASPFFLVSRELKKDGRKGYWGCLWGTRQVRLPDYSEPKEAKLRANAKQEEGGIVEGLGSDRIWSRECRSNGSFVRTK